MTEIIFVTQNNFSNGPGISDSLLGFYLSMHRLEICASSWHTHIFKAIEIVNGHLAHQTHQWKKTGKVQNTKLCLPNHICVHDTDWFKCHFWQLYFKADGSETFFLSLPFYVFVFTLVEHMSFLPGLHVWRSAWQQSVMKILFLREREVLKLKQILAQL